MIRNVLILMTDQHSREGLRCYGNPWMRTPNLDRMAAEGIQFRNTYCPAPLCVPSRMSFLTGDTPSKNRVWDNGHILESQGDTWIDALNTAGYATDLIGRMHYVGRDQRGAFQRRHLGEFMASPPGTPFEHPYMWKRISKDTAGQNRHSVEFSGTGRSFYQWFDERVTESTCDFLRERGEDTEPFMAVSGMVLPHCPFIAPRELFDYYYEHAPVAEPGRALPATTERYLRDRGLLDPEVSPERKRIARAAYFALCELVDRNVGAILETLKETGLDKNTLVVYVSDHGEMAGHKECWWKSCFYEDSVGIPMLFRGPDGWKPPQCIHGISNLMDLGPTVLDLLGVSPLRESQGRSLVPLLEGEGECWAQETISEFVDVVNPQRRTAAGMIRSGPWKLWEFADGEQLPPSLFNLEEDPGERNDLWNYPEYEGIGRKLRQRLREQWDPEYALKGSREKAEEYRALEESVVADPPEAPFQLIPPDEDHECDVHTTMGENTL